MEPKTHARIDAIKTMQGNVSAGTFCTQNSIKQISQNKKKTKTENRKQNVKSNEIAEGPKNRNTL